MKKTHAFLALLAVGFGLVVAVVTGVFAWLSMTATPIHPSAQDVSSRPLSSPGREWTDAVDQARQLVRSSVIEQNLPGISVAVGIDGELVWAEGFGWADIENKVPVGPQTRFKLGSASIPLTSAAVGLLLEKGRLRLDDTIQMHVPGFPQKKWPVTLGQVMGHTGGITRDDGDEGPFRTEHCDRVTEGLRLFADDSLRFEPGTDYRFSNYGYILVSAAVEATAQEPFYSFMQNQVFKPLGMDDTIRDSVTEPVPDRAIGYFPRGGDPRYGVDGGPRQSDYSCYAGGAAFVSTPSDLVRFGMAVNGGRFLKPATVDMLQSTQRLPSGKETGYGLGWDLEAATLGNEQTTLVGHNGDWMGGPIASLMIFPTHGIVVAVTSNIAYADTFGIGVKLAQVFRDRKVGAK